MKDPTLWDMLRRSWRRLMTQPGAGAPPPAQTASTEGMLLASALQALESDDMPSLMQSACRELRILSGADCTSVVLVEPDRDHGSCRIAAGDGWPTAVVGLQMGLPFRMGDAGLPPGSEPELAHEAWASLPLDARQGLSVGFWEPIRETHRTVGWITAHARDTSPLDFSSRPLATALAGILGSALRRDRTLRELRQEAAHRHALCQALPVLWFCIDGRAGTLLDCNAAIGSRLGRTAADCIGKPAAILFEGEDVAPANEILCRPAVTGAEVGVLFRLKHRNGSLVHCVADGVLLGEMGDDSRNGQRVLWVFHEIEAFQWAIQRSPDSHRVAFPRDFDWTLECNRERRQHSLRLLSSLRRSLHELHRSIRDGPTDTDGSGQAAQRATDRVRLLIDEAWQATEQAVIALAASDETITDLLSALQRLAEGVSESAPGLCVLEYMGQIPRLSDKAKLAAFRAARELLMQMVEEGSANRITVQVDTTAPGIVRLRLVRQEQEDCHAGKPHTRLHPIHYGSLGLFGIKMILAGVGGTLTISPSQHETIFAEFQVPTAAPVTTDDSVRAIGEK